MYVMDTVPQEKKNLGRLLEIVSYLNHIHFLLFIYQQNLVQEGNVFFPHSP